MPKMNKRAILVASFGTSHANTRDRTIGVIEEDIASAYPDFEIRRAFTSGMILKILAKRDGIIIDTVRSAMDRLAREGFHTVLVQPTHVINGDEYDDMVADVMQYQDNFEELIIGSPLLTDTEDYEKVILGIMEQFPDLDKKDALVLMGHGTEHHVNAVYAALDYRFKEMGYSNVFVGTVEAYPDLEVVLKQVKAYQPQKIILLPLMVVAGDHACNDMASEEKDSWKSIFEAEGYEVSCILKGLGEFKAIRTIYLEHISAAMTQR